MKCTAFLAALAATCLLAGPAAAAKPTPPPQAELAPAPSATTVVEAPTPISPLDVRGGGVGALPGNPAGGGPFVGPIGTRTADCGACIVQCWGAETRGGSGDWSGHAYIYQHLNWCGNGAQVTYASAWQSYDQAGWYQITSAYGPWWSDGCIGCGSIRASGYILWSWSTPFVSIHHYDTSWLNTTVYAWGGVSA